MTMKKLIECVPNFSEGRDQKKIKKIHDAIAKTQGIKILNITSDPDHNRTVITFAGEPRPVCQAAFLAVKTAAKLINLNKHKGVHPRVGATDVLPLIPLKNISISECIKLARELGKTIAEELKIPVYFYGKAASKPIRKNLGKIRNLGFEKLKKEILSNSDLKPDHGPAKLDPAGATMVGVRDILVAYNINLKTSNLSIAKKIAAKIRTSNGGLTRLPGVKALGLKLSGRKIVQVSMNLTNYKITGPKKVFALVELLAKKEGVEILESEIIGLIPAKALTECGKDYRKHLKLGPDFTESQILENALKNPLQ